MKDTIKRMKKTKRRMAGNIFTMYFFKGWYSENNELSKLGRKKTVVQLENGSSKHIMEELCVSEISIETDFQHH